MYIWQNNVRNKTAPSPFRLIKVRRWHPEKRKSFVFSKISATTLDFNGNQCVQIQMSQYQMISFCFGCHSMNWTERTLSLCLYLFKMLSDWRLSIVKPELRFVYMFTFCVRELRRDILMKCTDWNEVKLIKSQLNKLCLSV